MFCRHILPTLKASIQRECPMEFDELLSELRLLRDDDPSARTSSETTREGKAERQLGGDADLQLFGHAIAARPDFNGRKRCVLIVGLAPPR
jgi:hypothetical protein